MKKLGDKVTIKELQKEVDGLKKRIEMFEKIDPNKMSVENMCGWCGKLDPTVSIDTEKRQFCSEKCKREYQQSNEKKRIDGIFNRYLMESHF